MFKWGRPSRYSRLSVALSKDCFSFSLGLKVSGDILWKLRERGGRRGWEVGREKGKVGKGGVTEQWVSGERCVAEEVKEGGWMNRCTGSVQK